MLNLNETQAGVLIESEGTTLPLVVERAMYRNVNGITFQVGTNALVYIVPVPAVAILRFIHLATTRKDAESPTDAMLKDPVFMAAIVLYVVATGAVIYWG